MILYDLFLDSWILLDSHIIILSNSHFFFNNHDWCTGLTRKRTRGPNSMLAKFPQQVWRRRCCLMAGACAAGWNQLCTSFHPLVYHHWSQYPVNFGYPPFSDPPKYHIKLVSCNPMICHEVCWMSRRLGNHRLVHTQVHWRGLHVNSKSVPLQFHHLGGGWIWKWGVPIRKKTEIDKVSYFWGPYFQLKKRFICMFPVGLTRPIHETYRGSLGKVWALCRFAHDRRSFLEI